MKKKAIFGGIAVFAIAVAIAMNINMAKSNNLSRVSLTNAEALAQYEIYLALCTCEQYYDCCGSPVGGRILSGSCGK